jgi:hypothetical protein
VMDPHFPSSQLLVIAGSFNKFSFLISLWRF